MAVARGFRAMFGGKKVVLPPLSLLVLGEYGRLPGVAGVTYVTEPERGFDGIVVASEISRAEVFVALEKARRPLAPVLDFSGKSGGRADYENSVLKAFTLEEGLVSVLPVIERSKEVASPTDSLDAQSLLALGLAYTRDTAIEAEWDPQLPQAVRYPLLAGLPKTRRLLETLADLGLLRRRFFARVNVCGHCESSRLNAEEQCPNCRSADLDHRPDAKPAYSCRACGATSEQPIAAFVCLDCGKATLAPHVETVDWYHYDPNDDAVTAVRTGRLPKVRLEELLRPYPQAQSVRDFLVLAEHGIKTAQRYRRPYSIFDITLGNAEEIQDSRGPRKAREALAAVVEILVDMLRTSDLVTARENRILVALPETKATNAGIIMLRLKKKVSQTIHERLHLECRVTQGERGLKILEGLR